MYARTRFTSTTEITRIGRSAAPAGPVRKIGRDPRPRGMDLMIAAVAGVNQLPLLTRNPKDFVGLETAVRVIGV